MRFPNDQLIKRWGHFDLVMKTTPAQISIKPWSPAVGAKGELQMAWFRVKNIPYDKRCPKTLAYVGSLVGAAVEIDEKSLTRVDYVRMKIACRDVTKVPQFAEGAIIPFIYDFEFERESINPNQPSRETIDVSTDNSNTGHNAKKPRIENEGGEFKETKGKMVGGSAPPKVSTDKYKGAGSSHKMLADAMKACGKEKGNNEDQNDGEKLDVSWNASDDELLYEDFQDEQEEQSNMKNVWLTKCIMTSHMMKDMNKASSHMDQMSKDGKNYQEAGLVCNTETGNVYDKEKYGEHEPMEVGVLDSNQLELMKEDGEIEMQKKASDTDAGLRKVSGKDANEDEGRQDQGDTEVTDAQLLKVTRQSERIHGQVR